MIFRCPHCESENEIRDSLIPEYGCWCGCKICKKAIMLSTKGVVTQSDTPQKVDSQQSINNLKLEAPQDANDIGSAKYIGKLRARKSSSYVTDLANTKYEVVGFDQNKLRDTDYIPKIVNVRVMPKGASGYNNTSNYFVFDQNLYFNTNDINKKTMISFCEVIKEKRIKSAGLAENTIMKSEYFEQDNASDITEISQFANIQEMTGLEFENLVQKLLIAMGFDVDITKQSGDGGIDLVAYNNQPLLEGKYIIQCKRWSATVGEPPIRDLYGVVTHSSANKGVLITNSSFTKSAIEFSLNKPIELIDGNKLNQLLYKYKLINTDVNTHVLTSNFDEDDELKEKLNILSGLIKSDNNISLIIRLVQLQIHSIWYGTLSKLSKLNMIIEAENNINTIIAICNKYKDLRYYFIKHISYSQLGYIKTIQGDLAKAITLYINATHFQKYLPAHDDDICCYKKETYSSCKSFVIRNLLNVLSLSRFLVSSNMYSKILSEHKKLLSDFVEYEYEMPVRAINPYYNFLKSDWKSRTFYILNYDAESLDPAQIVSDSAYGDSYNCNYSCHLMDLAHLFEKFNYDDKLFSITEDQKKYQRKAVDLIY